MKSVNRIVLLLLLAVVFTTGCNKRANAVEGEYVVTGQTTFSSFTGTFTITANDTQFTIYIHPYYSNGT